MKISKKELKKLINESINYADGSKLDVDGENFKVYPKYGEMNLVILPVKRVHKVILHLTLIMFMF